MHHFELKEGRNQVRPESLYCVDVNELSKMTVVSQYITVGQAANVYELGARHTSDLNRPYQTSPDYI